MKVRLFGAAKEVTGSCYSIETDKSKVLVDCGFFQGSKDNERKNYEDFKFIPKEYNALILTHAHLDHSGRVPKLIKYGFKGKIFATPATRELAFIIMMDTVKIAMQDTANENERRIKQGLPPRKPIYSETDVKNTMKLFVDVEYKEVVKITEDISVRFVDAGHILGAASIDVTIREGKKSSVLVFSGDIGQAKSILVREIDPLEKADYVFMESTYGDRLHPPIEERKKEFLRIIKETYNRGGKLLIPSFAVERTQELLYYLSDFFQEGLIPKMKVYLDSPMAMKATEVFSKYKTYYNDQVQYEIIERKKTKGRQELFDFPELVLTKTVEESKKINNVEGPCIIIAGNGMCTAGRIKHHIRNNISNPKTTLLFVGYQATGTLGYWIKNKEKKIRLLGQEVLVKAHIESIDGFSAHADYNELISWLNNFKEKPKKVFICHGEEEQALAFKKRIEKLGYSSYIPELYEEIVLE